MEYVYVNGGWYNLDQVSNNKIEHFNSASNKKRIKLYNRFSGIKNGRGYTYIDPEDILFIWSDGTLYGESSSYGISSSFNINSKWIVNKRRTKKLVNDTPGAIMNYILTYVDILMRDPDFWIKSTEYYRKVDRNKIYKIIKDNIENQLTDEQYFVYELQKDEIDKMLDDYEATHKEVNNGY